MPELKLLLASHNPIFAPNEVVPVIAEWSLESPQTSLELRLTWYTRGKGGTDCEIVQRWRFDNPQLQDSKLVDVSLPDRPYSFSGKLISLQWTFELIAEPSGDSTRADFTLAPNGHEIVLHREPVAAVSPQSP